jgi:crotonobetainyl-CoA:carnitine CoA-transferase CaiB-like acyl-CoA transferase
VEAGRTDLKSVASPVDFLGTDSSPTKPVPSLGEHTISVLQEAGVDKEIIDKIVEQYRAGAPEGRARL